MFSWPWRRAPQNPSYKIYTTEFDLICSGDALTLGLTKEERAAWLESCLAYERAVDCHRVGASVSCAEVVDRVIAGDHFVPEEHAVTILVDHSGSLKGQRAILACLLTEVLSDFLSRLGVAYEVLGFTTRHWCGGKSREKWMASGHRPNPGRLADILHVIHRDALNSAPSVPHSIRHLLRGDFLKENIDGEALLWASERLKSLGRQKNLIIVISDGAPVDDSTLSANTRGILCDHLRAVVSSLEQAPNFGVIGIGIDYDLSAFYADWLMVKHLESLADAVIPAIVGRLRVAS